MAFPVSQRNGTDSVGTYGSYWGMVAVESASRWRHRIPKPLASALFVPLTRRPPAQTGGRFFSAILNLLLEYFLELQHQPGRDSDVILPSAVEAGLQQVALHAPGKSRNQAVIDSAADSVSKT